MSKRVSAEEYEEQDTWIARLRDRWFGESDEVGQHPADPVPVGMSGQQVGAEPGQHTPLGEHLRRDQRQQSARSEYPDHRVDQRDRAIKDDQHQR